jgi:30S ribosome assembly GTPase
MIKKCVGCGVNLQSDFNDKDGYTNNLDNNYCERCFRISHYGDYKTVIKSNEEFTSILQEVNKSNDLVLIVVDLFDLPQDMSIFNDFKYKVLILNKRDIFAKDIYDSKFLDYIKGHYLDKLIISSDKNYNFDSLLGLINKYKKSSDVYVVGYTNAGKSTMINKLIYNYSDYNYKITTSILPSTTLDMIKIKLNEHINIIDTPGLLVEGSIINYLTPKDIKKIIPKQTIRPLIYQVKSLQYILIDKYALIETSGVNLTLFFSSNLEIERSYNKIESDLKGITVIDAYNEDVVIKGLGFIKVSGKGKLIIHTLEDVLVYKRESLI